MTHAASVQCIWFGFPHLFYIVQFEKILIPPHGKSMEFTKARGVSNATVLNEKYGAKLEYFAGGWGCKPKTFHGRGRGYRYSLESHTAVYWERKLCTHEMLFFWFC